MSSASSELMEVTTPFFTRIAALIGNGVVGFHLVGPPVGEGGSAGAALRRSPAPPCNLRARAARSGCGSRCHRPTWSIMRISSAGSNGRERGACLPELRPAARVSDRARRNRDLALGHFGVVFGPCGLISFRVVEGFADDVLNAHSGGGIAHRAGPRAAAALGCRLRLGFSPSANLMPGMAPSNFISSAFLPQRIFITMVLPPMEFALRAACWRW